MTGEIWLTFMAVVVVFALIPGPTVILVVGQAITHGRNSVLPLVTGVLCGDFIAMSLSLIGLGAVLATSASLFFILKWFGVGYLIYLGVQSWRAKPSAAAVPNQNDDQSWWKLFRSSFLVTALNPKDIIFFVAFLPQFLNPNAEALPQLLILMATFLGVIAITITFFAVFAGLVAHRIQSQVARKRMDRLSGSALLGAGLLTATMQHS